MKRSTVLIVDDESYIREFLAQILSEHFQIAFAKNGKEAVETAKSIQPDIIVLDVLMPGQNGIDTCKVLREQKESSSTPIIMLTAVNEPEQRIKAFNAGADDYFDLPGKNRSRSNVISGPRKGSGNAKEEVHGRGNHYASSDS